MNLADTLRGFLRRWYIVLPGLILAVAAGLGAYSVVQPGYERTATQLLLPGEGTVPPGTTNPYLFLGGLTQAADIVVRVMKSDEVVGPVVAEYPGTEVLVQRDPTVSGPVVQIVVTATSDAAADGALAALVEQTGTVLDRLQVEQNVTDDDLMTISTLTQDTQSIPQQKTRLVISAGVAMGLVVLTLLVASLVDGLIRRVRRGGRQGAPISAASTDRDTIVDEESIDVTDPMYVAAHEPPDFDSFEEFQDFEENATVNAPPEEDVRSGDTPTDAAAQLTDPPGESEAAPENDDVVEHETPATRGRRPRAPSSRSR